MTSTQGVSHEQHNSSLHNYPHSDNHNTQTTDTAKFKPCTKNAIVATKIFQQQFLVIRSPKYLQYNIRLFISSKAFSALYVENSCRTLAYARICVICLLI